MLGEITADDPDNFKTVDPDEGVAYLTPHFLFYKWIKSKAISGIHSR